jgi:hypothetical protein
MTYLTPIETNPRNSIMSATRVLFATALFTVLTACGNGDPTGGSSAGEAGAPSQVSPNATGSGRAKGGRVTVAVSPPAATVGAGGTVAFTARVSGSKNTAVTWSIREPSCGSIAASGVYTAPASAAVCHVDATSAADPTAVAEATATVTAPAAPPPPAPAVAVTITPANAAVDACQTLAFTASVSGTTNGAVTWAVQEGTAGGTITPAGVYSAPNAAGTYHVIATSQADATSSTTTAITVTDRIVGVAVSPATATLAPGATAQFTATVTTTCGSFTSTNVVTAPN